MCCASDQRIIDKKTARQNTGYHDFVPFQQCFQKLFPTETLDAGLYDKALKIV